MSMRYLKKAAATGESNQILRLAVAYELGRLTPQDSQTAANLRLHAKRRVTSKR